MQTTISLYCAYHHPSKRCIFIEGAEGTDTKHTVSTMLLGVCEHCKFSEIVALLELCVHVINQIRPYQFAAIGSDRNGNSQKA